MHVNRRSFLGAATALLASGTARARALDAPREIDLWSQPPGTAPSPGPERVSDKGALTHVTRPRLRVYRPDRPNGTAIVVIAGGGYAHLEAGPESTPVCRWLQSIGVAGFELIYRMPEDGWAPIAPFQDGQRAMRLVRSQAGAYGVHADRIGIMGFSAGGHLAGMTETRPQAELYPAQDAADRLSARPDFAALLYPVLTFMPPFDHTRSRREIVGTHPTEAESAAFSVERLVDAHTPPTFLAQASDDPISPIDNSRMMFAALQAAHVPSELHVFPSGGHGWGMGRPGTETTTWPTLFAAWATKQEALGG
jgi:acetyl esterase/lipase